MSVNEPTEKWRNKIYLKTQVAYLVVRIKEILINI